LCLTSDIHYREKEPEKYRERKREKKKAKKMTLAGFLGFY